jgi:hypothetical protein
VPRGEIRDGVSPLFGVLEGLVYVGAQ